MPQVGFKPAILASERPHAHASDRAATGIGSSFYYLMIFVWVLRSILTLSQSLLSLIIGMFS